MQQQDLLGYITNLQLAPGNEFKPQRRTLGVESMPSPSISIEEEKVQSFFSEKSIISFAADVSSEIRQDVLNTTLFAQMAANTVPENDEQIIEWYKKFVEVLGKTGWIITGKDMQNYHTKGSIFEVESVIIDILTGVFGASYVTIIKKTLEAIKGLGNEDRKIKAFERNVTKLSKGYFQVALASEKNGMVSLQLGTFILDSTKTITSILFFKTESNETNLQYISKNASFNSEVYSSIRNTVSQRLGNKLVTNIAEIPLA